MATTQDTTYPVGHDETGLVNKTEALSFAEQGQADEAHGLANGEQNYVNGEQGYVNGEHEHANYAAPYDEGLAHNNETIGRESSEYPQSEARPS
jgi:hypothetical protein